MKAIQKQQNAGFTLVEVLIAIVILSVGLLGLVGLQTLALRQNHSSQHRSLAVDFINELADRMRANRTGVDANHYAADPQPAPLPAAPPLPADPGFDCISRYPGGKTVCDAQEMAQVDLYVWKTSASRIFPGSQITVTCTDNRDPGFDDPDGDKINNANTDGDPCTDGSLFIVSLSWVDHRDRDGATNPSPINYRMTFIP